jgi:4'-phosphopantetheinyl transferase
MAAVSATRGELTGFLRLSAGAVMLWWMVVDALPAPTVARWLATLDERERTQADRLRFAIDRETYIAAHALARALLSHVDRHPPSAWRFVERPGGKPQIDPALGALRKNFNLSHTRGLVACAVALDDEIGVDVEAEDRDTNELDIARHVFAPDEVSLLRSLAVERRRRAFFRIWTLKEAYIKATGQGLTCPMDAFAFGLDPIAIRFRSDIVDDPANWQFAQFQATRRHVIAVAARRPVGLGSPTSRAASPELRVIQRIVSTDEI